MKWKVMLVHTFQSSQQLNYMCLPMSLILLLATLWCSFPLQRSFAHKMAEMAEMTKWCWKMYLLCYFISRPLRLGWTTRHWSWLHFPLIKNKSSFIFLFYSPLFCILFSQLLLGTQSVASCAVRNFSRIERRSWNRRSEKKKKTFFFIV